MSGASNRRSVAVWIAGQEYKLRSDGDDDGLIRIAGYVDRAMQRVRERTGTVDSLDVAVLTCLNLAREILAWHERPSSDVGDEKLRLLIERVESALTSAPAGTAAEPTAEPARPPASDVASRPRTLELPSVEDLTERIAASAAHESLDASDSAPLVRAAAGGRERVG